jgi:hypothetical protein
MEMNEELLRLVAKILYEEWDPIGLRRLGVRKNQYERYAEGLLEAWRIDPSVEKVSSYLGEVYFRIFGRIENDPSRSLEVARRISALLKCNIGCTES